jgi:hypothetical protein
MSSFEFAFSLIGLVLGLSVAEIVSGFARVLRSRKRIRLGWTTPLLGTLLFIDLVTFWNGAWRVRDILPTDFIVLLAGTFIAAIYYLAASLVFPDDVTEWPDLDDYFRAHKVQVLIVIVLANWLVSIGAAALKSDFVPAAQTIVVHASYSGACLALALVRSRRIEIAFLAVLISLYFIFYFI